MVHKRSTTLERSVKIFYWRALPKIVLFVKCLKQYHRKLKKLNGKITVIKNYALPKLIYWLLCYFVFDQPSSSNSVKELKSVFMNFYWMVICKQLGEIYWRRSMKMEIMNIHGSYIVFKCVVSRFQRTLNSNACTADWKRACKAFL